MARWCDGQNLAEAAASVRGWVRAQSPYELVLPQLAVEKLPDAADGETVPDWQQRLLDLRRKYAERLFEIAGKAAAEKQAGLAWLLAHEVIRQDPSNAAARRLLGYELVEGAWRTAYEAQRARARQVWHPLYGWLRQDHVPRYEAGERYYKNRWMSAEDEAALRSRLDQGWDVMTEHYLVHTNHSLEEGVRLAARLERLQAIWRQVFVRFYASDAQVASWFRKGRAERSGARRHHVIYFRDRDEYTRALVERQPKIGITTGYYDGGQRKAYFFAGPEQNDANLLHEATHQLFSESRNVTGDIGRQANFWIVEGIACYFESLVEGDGTATLGGTDAVRLRDARFRLVEDDFYVPLAELTGYGVATLQHDERIAMLYSQSAGLTHFLMHDGDGRYRNALIDYLVLVYTGRDRIESLAELTGVELAELDRQYRGFIEGLPAE